MPPLGFAEDAELGDCAPVNAPALVAEELGLDERLGDGPAVDDEERLVLAVAALVDGARDALFARAALAGDEDSRARRRDALHEIEDAAHRLGSAEQLPRLAADLRPKALVLGDDARASRAPCATSARSSFVANGFVTKS